MNLLATILIPFLTAVYVLFIGKNSSARVSVLSSAVSVVLIGVLIALYFIDPVSISGIDVPWIKSVGINFSLAGDGLSLFMVLISNVITMISLYVAMGDNNKKNHQYYALILFMQAAMNGVFLATDLFLYYIFWELVLVPAYFLLLGWGSGEKIRSVTLKFFLYTLLGSLLMLVAIVWLGSQAGDYSLESVRGLSIGLGAQVFIFVAFLIAYFIKTPVFPFHSWMADTYTSASAPVTILFSAVMSKMALYSIIRFVLPLVPEAIEAYGVYAVQLAGFSVLFASFTSLAQKDIKRMFAYVSMAHVGLIAAGLLTNTVEGVHGGLVMMAAHAINTSGLFIVAHIIYRRTGTHQISALGGLRQHMPIFAGMYLVVLFSSIGLPLTNGFLGEFMVFVPLFKYNLLATLFASTGIVIAAVYMLMTFKNVMQGPDAPVQYRDVEHHDKFVLVTIAFIIVITGFYSTWITELCDSSVLNLLTYLQK